MPDFSTDKITQLEKENRKVRRQLKNVNEKYKSLKLKKNQIEADSYKEKALPAHYQTIEQDYLELQKFVQQLTQENRQLKERSHLTKHSNTIDLEKELELSKQKIQELEKQNQKMYEDLRNSKAEIAEVLIDAKKRVGWSSFDIEKQPNQLEVRLKKELSDLTGELLKSKEQIDSLVTKMTTAIESTLH